MMDDHIYEDPRTKPLDKEEQFKAYLSILDFISTDSISEIIIQDVGDGKNNDGTYIVKVGERLFLKKILNGDKLNKEVMGVFSTLCTSVDTLKPVYFNKSDSSLYYIVITDYVTDEFKFKRNLLMDLSSLRSIGLQHCDVTPDNVSPSGNLIDAGLVSKIGGKPRKWNPKTVTAYYIEGEEPIVDDSYDIRCVINQGGLTDLYNVSKMKWMKIAELVVAERNKELEKSRVSYSRKETGEKMLVMMWCLIILCSVIFPIILVVERNQLWYITSGIISGLCVIWIMWRCCFIKGNKLMTIGEISRQPVSINMN
jgi:hypothetical protein